MNWPWSVLGIDQDATERDVKRAYAVRLKAIDQKTDTEGFLALRQAYERARAIARRRVQPAPKNVAPPKKDELIAGDQSVQDVQLPKIETVPAAVTRGPEPVAPPPAASEPKTTPPKPSQPTPKKLFDPSEIFGAAHQPADEASEDDTLLNVDWRDVTKCTQDAEALIRKGDFGVDAWRPLIFNDALDLPGAAESFEASLVNALIERYAPHFTMLRATPGWIRLIEQRFAWSTDGLRLVRRFPRADRLHTRFSRLYREQGVGDAPYRQKPTSPPRQVEEAKPFYLRWWFILVAYLIFLVLRLMA